jgi:hypothetical protein
MGGTKFYQKQKPFSFGSLYEKLSALVGYKTSNWILKSHKYMSQRGKQNGLVTQP